MIETKIKLILLKKRNFFKKEAKRIIGEDTIAATLAIIEHYKPEA